MKTALLIVALLPFLYFAFRDNVFHFNLRKVSPPEHLIHLFLGVFLVVFVRGAFRGFDQKAALSMLGLGIFGSLDEFIYHRDLPVEEANAHAKEHWSLLLFLLTSLLLPRFLP